MGAQNGQAPATTPTLQSAQNGLEWQRSCSRLTACQTVMALCPAPQAVRWHLWHQKGGAAVPTANARCLQCRSPAPAECTGRGAAPVDYMSPGPCVLPATPTASPQRQQRCARLSALRRRPCGTDHSTRFTNKPYASQTGGSAPSSGARLLAEHSPNGQVSAQHNVCCHARQMQEYDRQPRR